MPFGTGDILKFTTDMTFVQQKCRNVWYYRIEAVINTMTGDEIAAAFYDFVQTTILPALSNSVAFNSVSVDNVSDGLSFGEHSESGITGALAGEHMGPFVAYSFMLTRGSKITRNGFKRIAGVMEDLNSAGNVNSGSASYSKLTTIEAALDDTLNLSSASGQMDVRPIIYGDVTPNRPTPVWQYVTGAVLQPRLTTQSSRKVGRGE